MTKHFRSSTLTTRCVTSHDMTAVTYLTNVVEFRRLTKTDKFILIGSILFHVRVITSSFIFQDINGPYLSIYLSMVLGPLLDLARLSIS
jgi:hypothetical protein